MKNIEVKTHGIYSTIGHALGISGALACVANNMETNPRHKIVKELKSDLIKAQENVLIDYQKKGLI